MTDRCLIVFASLRSGSTMLRLMLDSHPGMACNGEHDYLFDFLHHDARGWYYDRAGILAERIFRNQGLILPETDDGEAILAQLIAQIAERGQGLPVLMLHRNLSKALQLLPEAPVVHMLRDPRDVARSSIGMMWAGNVYFGVDTWLRTEQDWQFHGHLAEDRTLTISYESLVAQPEKTLTRLAAHAGFEFAPSMLSYGEVTTYDRPDPALAEQWRRKLAPKEIALVEGKVGDLLTARGYAPSGVSPVIPSPPYLLWLRINNRWGVWRRLVREYGWAPLIKQRLGRMLGLRGLEQAGRREREAIALSRLK